MKRWLSIAVLFAMIACTCSLSFAQESKTDKPTHTYTGGIEGRVKNVLNPPLLTGPAKLVWDPKELKGDFSLNMAGGIARCNVTSSDGKNFEGTFSCLFTGLHAEGPVKGTLSKPDASGIPQKMQGNFDMTIPEQGGAQYIGTFNGEYRDW